MVSVSPIALAEELGCSGRPSARDAASRANRDRTLLVLLAALALAGTAALGTSQTAFDPDLVRLLRFMALLKGAFAVAATIASWWRLGRPSAAWREVVYVVGPGAMAAGALCLWTMQSAGLAALGLHVGLFALLAAGLTDDAFIPPLRRRA